MEFRYCKTPDCNQIYRSAPAGAAGVILRCPSCSSEVCSACDDVHEGLTCKEYQARKLEERVNTWINQQGGSVRRCPQCRVPIEKVGGCNHMTCRSVFHSAFSTNALEDSRANRCGANSDWNYMAFR
ncbi:hypothetical protein EDD16DRAFT_1594993 [Pisolithus croceorrhizus]|nr:hypothetical protein EDD16DRAFT_1594993 [Pisolithus croceorrhizus]